MTDEQVTELKIEIAELRTVLKDILELLRRQGYDVRGKP